MLEVSFSAFDPQRTLDGCGLQVRKMLDRGATHENPGGTICETLLQLVRI
jgi:hypothetical protein